MPGLGIKWSILLSVLFYIVFAVTYVLQLIAFLRMLHPGEVVIDAYSLVVFPQMVAWCVTIIAGLKWSGMTLREARFEVPFPAQILPALLVTSLGAAIVLVELVLWIPMPELFRRSILESQEHASFLTIFVPLVVVAPLAEEFFFRGLLMRDYLERYSISKSVWTSSIIFAIFHLNPWQTAVALPLGVWCAWLVLRTGSLIPGIVCHAAYNFSAAFLLKPLALALGCTAQEWQSAEHLPPRLVEMGAALSAFGGTVIWWQLAGTEAVVIDSSNGIEDNIVVRDPQLDSADEGVCHRDSVPMPQLDTKKGRSIQFNEC